MFSREDKLTALAILVILMIGGGMFAGWLTRGFAEATLSKEIVADDIPLLFPTLQHSGWKVSVAPPSSSRRSQTTVNLHDKIAIIHPPEGWEKDYWIHEGLHVVLEAACMDTGRVWREAMVRDLSKAIVSPLPSR